MLSCRYRQSKDYELEHWNTKTVKTATGDRSSSKINGWGYHVLRRLGNEADWRSTVCDEFDWSSRIVHEAGSERWGIRAPRGDDCEVYAEHEQRWTWDSEWAELCSVACAIARATQQVLCLRVPVTWMLSRHQRTTMRHRDDPYTAIVSFVLLSAYLSIPLSLPFLFVMPIIWMKEHP